MPGATSNGFAPKVVALAEWVWPQRVAITAGDSATMLLQLFPVQESQLVDDRVAEQRRRLVHHEDRPRAGVQSGQRRADPVEGIGLQATVELAGHRAVDEQEGHLADRPHLVRLPAGVRPPVAALVE